MMPIQYFPFDFACVKPLGTEQCQRSVRSERSGIVAETCILVGRPIWTNSLRAEDSARSSLINTPRPMHLTPCFAVVHLY